MHIWAQRQVQGVCGEYSFSTRTQGTDPTPLLQLDLVISNRLKIFGHESRDH